MNQCIESLHYLYINSNLFIFINFKLEYIICSQCHNPSFIDI